MPPPEDRPADRHAADTGVPGRTLQRVIGRPNLCASRPERLIVAIRKSAAGMTDSERPERPPPDASPEEVARWRERDFGWALATAMGEEESEEDEADDETE